jgi:TetR/AcrR family tetracycline transcriptional repressor
MRAVAQRLDVSPNSLYSHVANKTDLIDEILDDVLADVDAPEATGEDPTAGLCTLMASTYQVLLAHPDLVPLYLARQGAHGANAHRLGDIMLGLLDRGGVTGPAAHEALRVLIVYTIGFAAFATQGLLLLTSDSTPPSSELADNFNNGLRWLLAGIGVAVPMPSAVLPSR